MTGEVEIRRFEIDDDGEQLNVKVEVHNNADRTLYAYREVRGIKYDEPSKTLRLLLTDRYVTEGPVRFMVLKPPLIPIDPGESETISFRVARFITQLGPQQGDRVGPTLREIPVHEAQAVEAEISWSDTPFYREPKVKGGQAEQVRRWERGVIESRVDRPKGGEGPPYQGGKKSR